MPPHQRTSLLLRILKLISRLLCKSLFHTRKRFWFSTVNRKRNYSFPKQYTSSVLTTFSSKWLVFFSLNFFVSLNLIKKTNKPKVVLTSKVEGRSGKSGACGSWVRWLRWQQCGLGTLSFCFSSVECWLALNSAL